MRLWKISFLCLAVTLSMTACGDDDDDTPGQGGSTATEANVTITPSEINAAAAGGEYALDVVNHQGGGWTAYAQSTCSSWVTVATPSWASAGSKVTVTIAPNTGNTTRTGEVVIKAGAAMKAVKVTQDAPMSLSSTQVYSPSKGKTAEIEVKASSAWTATADCAWIHAEKADDTTLRITTDQNDDTADRTGTVTVSTAAEKATVNVTQSSSLDRVMNIPEGYHLVWNDEFETGSVLSSDWVHEVQRSGWVNNELQNYVDGSYDGTRVTEIKDGHLVITAFKASDGKVYSGRVYGKRNQGFTYGYFEARMILPKGKGTWPAYWMMPVNFRSWPDDGEIDIMEHVGYHPGYTSSSIHCKAYYHSIGTQKTAETYTAGCQDEFHIYALEWTEDYITTYIDGKELFRFKNDGKGDKKTWPFNTPFYPIFNLAWGGDWGGAMGVDESALPATFTIDYIRVFQKD